jgi:cytidine deaminase
MDLGHISALGCEVSNGLQLLAAPAGDEDLVRMALVSANRSYAPYSACPSGVALQLSSGKIVQGSYWESCAFNPSISPVQAGIVSVISAGASPADIVACVLVQLLDARVSQARGPAPVSQPWQPSILA